MKHPSAHCLLLTTVAIACFVPSRHAVAETIYVSNAIDNTIVTFTAPAGSVFANTHLDNPYGLAFDGAGNLYVANRGDSTIVRFAPDGSASIFAAGSGNGSSLFGPTGMAFDTEGNLYVANYGFIAAADATIEKFTPAGLGSVFVANPGDSSVLDGPVSLAFDHAGNLYVANSGSSTIEKIAPSGEASVFANAGLNDPWGLAFDSAGNLYVSNQNAHNIEKFSPDGVDLGSFSSVGSAIPHGIAFDGGGNLLVTLDNNTVEKYSPAGADLGTVMTTGADPAFVAVQSVPEPSTTILCGMAVLLFGGFRQRHDTGP